MTESKICTCPSGDGSLRWPCPKHPAVEQAGGDERAAFEAYRDRRNALLESEGHNPGSKWHVTNAHYPTWEASRASLAQPSPVRSSLLINGYQLRAALDFIAPDGTAEQLESEACIEWRQQDADFLEAGLYAFCAEYPEEGGVLLDEEPTTAQPSPLQSEQAEAERPEVVAYLFVKPDGTLSMDAVRHKPSQPAVAVMTVAQHERIVGELRADRDSWAEQAEQRLADWDEMRKERDAALARVEELERQEPVDVPGPGPDEIHQMAFEEGQPAEDGDGYLFSAEEFDLFVQRLLDSCATPVAWAQHSVPDGASDLCRFLAKLYCELDGLRYSTAKLPAEQIADALIFKWPVLQGARNQLNIKRISEQPYDESKLHSAIAAMLAAAPGKEVPQAWLDVQAERRRQITAEGWTPVHDDLYCAAELPRAAAAYILNGANDEAPAIWPFVAKWWKPRDARSNYVRAGALILAEIERLDRAGISQSPQPGATTASS
ncbi:hypothetical protein ABLG14_002308 [Pseudomonas aeruginosa]